jgi:diguanylate cyclase (GGDEF)-like protein/PAS domain S-box-containing protein
MTMSTTTRPTESMSLAGDAIFRAAFDKAPGAAALTEADGRWFRVNAALCELLGYTEEELLALTPHDLTAPGMTPVTLSELGDARRETCYVRADGDPVWVSVRAGALGDGRFVVQIGNLTERKRAERRLRRLADHDPLTWLPNRRFFLEGLADELTRMSREGEFGALLLIDLDHFKEINDTAGHAAGDRVLQATADVLRRRLRSTDLLGRLGGDEFAALVPNVTPRQARNLADSLAEALRSSVVVYGETAHHIQASIGVADIDERTGTDEDALLVSADEAMYRAKAAGRWS